MLRWPIRIASVAALSVLAYGWGDFATQASPEGAIVLGILSILLFAALLQLYRPGGMAAFDDGSPRRAPGEAVPDPSPMIGPPPRPPKPRPEPKPKREKAPRSRLLRAPERREATPPAPSSPSPPPAPAPAPAPVPAPPAPPRRRESGGSLWASGRGRAEDASRPAAPAPRPAAPGAIDLNAATVDQLAMLPGIGRGAAARVVAHREAHGPFRSLNGLADVEGFDAARVARVAGRLRVES